MRFHALSAPSETAGFLKLRISARSIGHSRRSRERTEYRSPLDASAFPQLVSIRCVEIPSVLGADRSLRAGLSQPAPHGIWRVSHSLALPRVMLGVIRSHVMRWLLDGSAPSSDHIGAVTGGIRVRTPPAPYAAADGRPQDAMRAPSNRYGPSAWCPLHDWDSPSTGSSGGTRQTRAFSDPSRSRRADFSLIPDGSSHAVSGAAPFCCS